MDGESPSIIVMHSEPSMPKTYTIVIIVLGLLSTTGALACSCGNQTESEQFQEATYIARVRVTATELRSIKDLRDEIPDYKHWENDISEYVRVSYEEIEAFKGGEKRPRYLRELIFAPGNCMLGLLTGMEFVVYLSNKSNSFVTICSGSFGYLNAQGTEVAPVLDRLRDWSKALP